MILNGAAIRAAAAGFRALYKTGFEQAAPTYPDFVVEVPSTGPSETYNLIDGLPQLREWVGERQVQNLKAFDYTLANRDWELTIGVPRNLFMDDRLGLIRPKFQAMGAAARLHPDKLFGELLAAGFSSGKGYDAKVFFSASHPLKTGVQSNLVSGALATGTFNEAIQHLRQMKSWQLEPIDVFAFGGTLTLVVGPALESTARALVISEFGSAGASNPDFNRAKLRVFNRITDNSWFLGIAGGPLRPFIHQVREQPQVVARDQVDDDCVFERGEVQYGCNGRWEMGYGLYQLIVGSAGT